MTHRKLRSSRNVAPNIPNVLLKIKISVEKSCDLIFLKHPQKLSVSKIFVPFKQHFAFFVPMDYLFARGEIVYGARARWRRGGACRGAQSACTSGCRVAAGRSGNGVLASGGQWRVLSRVLATGGQWRVLAARTARRRVGDRSEERAGVRSRPLKGDWTWTKQARGVACLHADLFRILGGSDSFCRGPGSENLRPPPSPLIFFSAFG